MERSGIGRRKRQPKANKQANGVGAFLAKPCRAFLFQSSNALLLPSLNRRSTTNSRSEPSPDHTQSVSANKPEAGFAAP
ncbi:hypothetical protein GWI33_013198 [Rhynchophorus ferrugineus]|uniref:Uncharacterized protein n=1 Tax=Rhynchophorus ferrugineus TaxID=354439 RepID=A0A834M826_RHYFE|nr:hypothetical protein GWI33_013198 [Rhynchophorus ferrugineus]